MSRTSRELGHFRHESFVLFAPVSNDLVLSSRENKSSKRIAASEVPLRSRHSVFAALTETWYACPRALMEFEQCPNRHAGWVSLAVSPGTYFSEGIELFEQTAFHAAKVRGVSSVGSQISARPSTTMDQLRRDRAVQPTARQRHGVWEPRATTSTFPDVRPVSTCAPAAKSPDAARNPLSRIPSSRGAASLPRSGS